MSTARLLVPLQLAFMVLCGLNYSALADQSAGDACQTVTRIFVANLTGSFPDSVSTCGDTTYAAVPAGRLEVYSDKHCEPQRYATVFFFWLDHNEPARLVFSGGNVRSVELVMREGRAVLIIQDSFGHRPVSMKLYRTPVSLGVSTKGKRVAFLVYDWPLLTAEIQANKSKGPYLINYGD